MTSIHRSSRGGAQGCSDPAVKTPTAGAVVPPHAFPAVGSMQGSPSLQRDTMVQLGKYVNIAALNQYHDCLTDQGGARPLVQRQAAPVLSGAPAPRGSPVAQGPALPDATVDQFLRESEALQREIGQAQQDIDQGRALKSAVQTRMIALLQRLIQVSTQLYTLHINWEYKQRAEGFQLPKYPVPPDIKRWFWAHFVWKDKLQDQEDNLRSADPDKQQTALKAIAEVVQEEARFAREFQTFFAAYTTQDAARQKGFQPDAETVFTGLMILVMLMDGATNIRLRGFGRGKGKVIKEIEPTPPVKPTAAPRKPARPVTDNDIETAVDCSDQLLTELGYFMQVEYPSTLGRPSLIGPFPKSFDPVKLQGAVRAKIKSYGGEPGEMKVEPGPYVDELGRTNGGLDDQWVVVKDVHRVGPTYASETP